MSVSLCTCFCLSLSSSDCSLLFAGVPSYVLLYFFTVYRRRYVFFSLCLSVSLCTCQYVGRCLCLAEDSPLFLYVSYILRPSSSPSVCASCLRLPLCMPAYLYVYLTFSVWLVVLLFPQQQQHQQQQQQPGG